MVDRIILLWRKLPEQVRRLLVVFITVIICFSFARWILVPRDFGLLGHYRASSIKTNMEKPIRYAGAEACAECHDRIVATKKQGYHRGVSCEACHGPAASHTQDPENMKPMVTRTRTLCLLCHEYLPTRPTGFPQVISESHNPAKPCISCHKPHDPKPPQPLRKCEGCHAKIQRALALSNHSGLTCTGCHDTPVQHYTQPREFPPKGIQSRDACLRCHDRKAAPGALEAPRVDGLTHGEKYLCWQCHYPHMPEAR